MKIPFKLKLAFAISLTAVTITSASSYFYFSTTSQIIRSQLQERLRNIAHLGVLSLDKTDLQLLEKLVTEVKQKMKRDKSKYANIPAGQSLPSLTPEDEANIKKTLAYQRFVQSLRRINEGSINTITPYTEIIPPKYLGEKSAPLVFANLFIDMSDIVDRPAIAFVIDTMFDPESANPVGNIYIPLSRGITFTQVWQGEMQVDEDFYTDQFGTLMAASVPIKDSSGKTIAALGIDMDVSSEANKLNELVWIFGGTISASIVLSVLLAIWIAGGLSRPIQKLQTVAERVQERDFSVKVDLQTNDEWQMLAQVFNAMIKEIDLYSSELEDQVRERTAELIQANEEIKHLNQQLQSENLRMGAELNVLRRMQKLILPKPEELHISGLDIACFMEPAEEVGGDYYDILQTNGVITIGIGDVTGHGLESGILMLMTQTAVRLLQQIREVDPVRFLDNLNQTIYRNVQRMNSDKTLSLAILNYEEGRVSISGQHEEIIIVRKNASVERVDTIDLGFPIGLSDTISEFVNHTLIYLVEGDGVVLYTDGILEAENCHGELYGMKRFCQVLSENWHLTAEQIKNKVIADVRRHIHDHKVYDDITLLIVKRKCCNDQPLGLV